MKPVPLFGLFFKIYFCQETKNYFMEYLRVYSVRIIAVALSTVLCIMRLYVRYIYKKFELRVSS